MDDEKLKKFEQLAEIVSELGWTIGIPVSDDMEDVPGLIIGEKEFVDQVANSINKGRSVDKYGPPSKKPSDDDGDPTFH